MSQKDLDVIRGIMQAAADCYDGALDEKGNPIQVGLKREDGNPIVDSRTIDGFKVRTDGTHLLVTYESGTTLKEVYGTDFEGNLELTFGDIIKYLKKRYKQVTGNTISLTAVAECDAHVQKTNRARVWVVAKKTYKIGGVPSIKDRLQPSKDTMDAQFKRFLGEG
tara:strand:+ start:207 stop:701 length:495 start_codon:yes stop_codon:yes gene_type:complete